MTLNWHRLFPVLTVFAVLHVAQAIAATIPIPGPPAVNARSYYLVDHASGQVIAAQNQSDRLEPASITKLMTAYAVFHELAAGNIALEDEVTVSEKAWRMTGSRMFIEVGKHVAVEDLLQGMVVQSGNDASVALAEHVAGTEETFAMLMNQYAAELGMTNSNFENASGLPSPNHYTTARDIALLAAAIIREFPDFYRWYSQKEYTYNDIKQHNRNALLWRDPSVDGMKTGMTVKAGYCLVSSARRDDMRLISVVLGSRSEKSRADASQALLNYCFRFYETHRLYPAGEEITTARVWKGDAEEAQLGLKQDLYVTIPRGRYDQLSAEMDVRKSMLAPIDTEEAVGEVRVSIGDEILVQASLHALKPVSTGGFWTLMVDEVLLWFE